ncbi:MAG: winged helix-turn-helix transcriptional regulator [Alphaproteobacteria bacterium]|nr:winged helix-turn-helix transcriptional regulator [Alphaproteobacteria bacterium]
MRAHPTAEALPCRFLASPRFETFYALHGLTARQRGLHRGWLSWAEQRLSPRCRAALGTFQGVPAIWLALADIDRSSGTGSGFDSALAALAAVPARRLVRDALAALIHSDAMAESIFAGRPLTQALAALPARKREWLTHIGLFPPLATAPAVETLRRLVADPPAAKQAALEALGAFWRDVFSETWKRLRPQFAASVVARRREFAASGLAEFAKAYALRIEIDSGRGEIAALRGGYRLAFDRVAEIRLYPSAFNPQRFWTVLPAAHGRVIAHLPYVEPAADPMSARKRTPPPTRLPAPPLDPALIFRALGDPTRYAIAGLIAQGPMTSAELARILAVSPPTMSHHVHILREAGLLSERPQGGAIAIGLARRAVESISPLALDRWFGDGASPRPHRSRRRR